jgi:PST family polysaccharide transporter
MLKKIKEFLFENKNTRQTVAKNTIWLTISNFGGRAIKAGVIIYAARILGTAGYGVFSYAITLAGFLSLLVDPGINFVLVRDSAKATEEERRTLFATTFIIKLALIATGVGLLIWIGPIISTLPGAVVLIPAVVIILIFDAIREFCFSLLRSIERMQWEAGVFITTNLAILGFGFMFLLAHPTPLSLAWGYAIGTIVGGVFAIIVLRDYFRDLIFRFSSKLIRPLMTTAWPFAITGVLGMLFTNTDILIISWMKTASDVGIYSAAIRIIQVLYLVPGVIQLSTLPLFSRLAHHDNQKFRSTFERTLTTVFLISIPMAVGGIILGTSIMAFVFGAAFSTGGSAFKILMATLIFDFPGSILNNAIFAYGHQKSLIVTATIGGVSNVLFDLLLIPHFGMTGSAIATFIAQAASNGYLWYAMKKINYFNIFPHLKKIFMASGIMFLVTGILFLLHGNLLLNIAISTIVYCGALVLLREPLLKEVLKAA